MPENIISATQKDYDKAYAAFRKNPMAFSSVHNSAGEKIKGPVDAFDVAKIKSISIIKKGGSEAKIIENNPIDLE